MGNKIGMVSLGCPKNLVDSENMLGMLKDDGYEFTPNPEEAEVIIVNTCGFIESAKEESINAILEMTKYKETGKCMSLIVTGCLAQRYSEEIQKEIPEVDAIIGTGQFPEIAEIVMNTLDGKKIAEVSDIDRVFEEMPRVLSTPSYTSYIKISDGCDKFCTYCIIPKLRGKYRSRTIESIVSEAKELSGRGVKEIILIAQDTSCYGVDLYHKNSLHTLLEELSKVDGIEWIRFLYTYPENINSDLVKVMKSNEKICKYIDMPIQHSSNNILKRMGRRDTREDILKVISMLKGEMPNIVLRTSLIVGFPGETEEDFKDLCNFVSEARFDKLGVFTYSPEEDTPAANYTDQIEEDIKIKRYNKIMEIQREISYNNNCGHMGKIFKVLVTGKDKEFYIGRTCMDAPEIDGNIFFKSEDSINIGSFVSVKVTDVREYDILGEVAR